MLATCDYYALSFTFEQMPAYLNLMPLHGCEFRRDSEHFSSKYHFLMIADDTSCHCRAARLPLAAVVRDFYRAAAAAREKRRAAFRKEIFLEYALARHDAKYEYCQAGIKSFHITIGDCRQVMRAAAI